MMLAYTVNSSQQEERRSIAPIPCSPALVCCFYSDDVMENDIREVVMMQQGGTRVGSAPRQTLSLSRFFYFCCKQAMSPSASIIAYTTSLTAPPYSVHGALLERNKTE